MAVTVERLIATLEARFDKYERALAKTQGNTNRTFTAIEKRGRLLEQRLAAMGGNASRGLLGVFAAGVSLRGAQQLIDASTRIENSLKVAGLAGADLTNVYDELFSSAQRNAVPLEAMATLYGRIAQAQDALKVSQKEMTNFTDKIGVALRVAGSSATEASGALLQLSQALGAGTVRAEEYNSINEGARPILQAVAAGLKEAAGDVAVLRSLVMDGKVSSEAFFRAFEAGAYILEDKVAGAEMTVSQGFVRLQNVLIDTAGELDEGSEASRRMVKALELLGDWIDNTDFSPLISNVVEFGQHIAGVISKISELADAAGKASGVQDWVQSRLGGRREQDTIQDRIDGAFAADPKGDRKPATVTVTKPRRTVSLSDYDPPSTKTSGKSRKDRADEYERLTQRIIESTAATVAETEAQRQLNPLIDDYGYAVERARLEQELLNAAKAAGKKVTPELKQEIGALADQYATATVEAARLAEAQDDVRQAAEDAAQFNKDLARGIVDGFLEGKKAADIFADALRNVGSRLLDLAFDGAFGGGSNSGGGWLQSLIGGLFKQRATGGPVRKGEPYIVGERRPELFVPDQSGSILPRVPDLSVAKAGGGAAPQITYAPVYNFQGTGDEVAAFRREVARRESEFSARVVGAVRGAQKRRII